MVVSVFHFKYIFLYTPFSLKRNKSNIANIRTSGFYQCMIFFPCKNTYIHISVGIGVGGGGHFEVEISWHNWKFSEKTWHNEKNFWVLFWVIFRKFRKFFEIFEIFGKKWLKNAIKTRFLVMPCFFGKFPVMP